MSLIILILTNKVLNDSLIIISRISMIYIYSVGWMQCTQIAKSCPGRTIERDFPERNYIIKDRN